MGLRHYVGRESQIGSAVLRRKFSVNTPHLFKAKHVPGHGIDIDTNNKTKYGKTNLCSLLEPFRPEFAMTMTDSEKAIMMQHVAYWKEKLKQGKVYAFGPVIDPKEIYGLGVVAVENEQELKDIIANDPAGKINKYEYFPMKAVVPNISVG